MSEPRESAPRWWPHRLAPHEPHWSPTMPPPPRPNFRRSVITGVLALAALFTGTGMGGITRGGTLRYVVIGLTVVFVGLGASAVRSAARDVMALAQPRVGPSAASGLRFISSTIGYALVLFGLLQLLNVSPASLLVGGALTAAIVGLAAQQTLGNYFAGLVLLSARPYLVGQRITIHTGSMGGPFTGTVIDSGAMYVVLLAEVGEIRLPNAAVLASAIGPPEDPEEEPAEADPSATTDSAASGQPPGPP
jgi:small-conductance mechanosensitive channel